MSEPDRPEVSDHEEVETCEPTQAGSETRRDSDKSSRPGGIGSGLVTSLKVIERIVVIAAATAAFFPIVQYMKETEERQLSRYATIAGSIETCRNLLATPPSEIFDVPHWNLPIVVDETDVRLMCHHIWLEFEKTIGPLVANHDAQVQSQICSAFEEAFPDSVPDWCLRLQ